MQRLSIALMALVAWLCVVATAYAAPADPDARTRATEAHERARAAEAEMRFADAVKAYREAAQADPTAPFAPGSQVRYRWLERRSEGGFAPLMVFERFRRDPAAASDPARISALRNEAEQFPPGLVRTEAFLAVAESEKNLGNVSSAMDAWRRIVEDNSAPKGDRVISLRSIVETHMDRGEWSQARSAALRWGEVAPTVRDKTLKLYRRMVITRTSTALVVALVLAGAFGIVRLARTGMKQVKKAFSWAGLIVPAVVAVGGATFAWWNEGHGMQPFLIFGPGLLVLMLSARACRMAFRSVALRAAVAVLGALAALSLGWLSMLGSPGLMEGFGL